MKTIIFITTIMLLTQVAETLSFNLDLLQTTEIRTVSYSVNLPDGTIYNLTRQIRFPKTNSNSEFGVNIRIHKQQKEYCILTFDSSNYLELKIYKFQYLINSLDLINSNNLNNYYSYFCYYREGNENVTILLFETKEGWQIVKKIYW